MHRKINLSHTRHIHNRNFMQLANTFSDPWSGCSYKAYSPAGKVASSAMPPCQQTESALRFSTLKQEWNKPNTNFQWSSLHEWNCLLRCCTMQSGTNWPMFKRSFLPQSTGWWWCRQWTLLTHLLISIRLHGTCQKIVIFILAAVRIWSHTKFNCNIYSGSLWKRNSCWFSSVLICTVM
jgi:hypothetical protein